MSSSQEIIEKLVRRVCDEEHMTPEETELIVATLYCESGMNPKAVNKNKNGTVDYGLCQFNSYWYIGHGKPLKDKEEALNNPEKCVRIMCTRVKQGGLSDWICYRNGWHKKYLKPILHQEIKIPINHIETKEEKLNKIQIALNAIKAVVDKLMGKS